MTSVINIPDAILNAVVACSAVAAISVAAETWGRYEIQIIHTHKIFCRNQNFWQNSFMILTGK